MAFDVNKFTSDKWRAREAEIELPALAEFFTGKDKDGNPEKPIWKIRGLSGHELGHCSDAAAKAKDIPGLIERILGSNSDEMAAAIAKHMGAPDGAPDDIVKRLNHLCFGSVEPKCDKVLAGHLCKNFPIEFYTLTNKILELTGAGRIFGKKKQSNPKETTKQP